MPGLSIDDRLDFQTQVRHVCQLINAGHAPATLDLARWPSLAFGLEMALLDLQTGGQQRLFDTPFSNGAATLATHGLIWMDAPAKVLEQIERKLAQGFGVIKLKVGALPLAEECAILAAIRQNYAAEQVTLRLDANGAFTPVTALASLEQLAQFDVHFLEQPIRTGQWPAHGRHLCRVTDPDCPGRRADRRPTGATTDAARDNPPPASDHQARLAGRICGQ